MTWKMFCVVEEKNRRKLQQSRPIKFVSNSKAISTICSKSQKSLSSYLFARNNRKQTFSISLFHIFSVREWKWNEHIRAINIKRPSLNLKFREFKIGGMKIFENTLQFFGCASSLSNDCWFFGVRDDLDGTESFINFLRFSTVLSVKCWTNRMKITRKNWTAEENLRLEVIFNGSLSFVLFLLRHCVKILNFKWKNR